MRIRGQLYRIHIWLAWLVGLPLLFWTVSGLVMVARPIEDVRGENLKAAAPSLNMDQDAQFPTMLGKLRPIDSIRLIQQARGPVWIVSFHDKGMSRADAQTGRWAFGVDEAEARAQSKLAYGGQAKIEGMQRFTAAQAPLELRKSRPSWQARYSDGTHVYIDAETGETLALRTPGWRIYDWFWGLHIMDLEGREDSSHPILIGFAALAAFAVLLALIQLPLSVWRTRR